MDSGNCPAVTLPYNDIARLVTDLQHKYLFLIESWAQRLVRTYGTNSYQILGNIQEIDDLEGNLGATITAAELNWTIDYEWVRCAEDFLWRQTKLGLRVKEM